MTTCRSFTLLTITIALVFLKAVSGEENEGQQIANNLGNDLSFASKQFIRGFTSIFGPILDTIQGPSGGSKDDPMHNFRRVIIRDGINAVGKGAKAGATILSAPARVAGTGLEEARKFGQAGMAKSGLDSRMGLPGVPPVGNARAIEDGTKIASTLLNTTSSELSQANLGAVMLESAFKNRIKDIGNKTTSYVQSMGGQPHVPHVEPTPKDGGIKKREGDITTPSPVDELIAKFNEAVRQNDDRMLTALKSVLAQINPPKN